MDEKVLYLPSLLPAFVSRLLYLFLRMIVNFCRWQSIMEYSPPQREVHTNSINQCAIPDVFKVLDLL